MTVPPPMPPQSAQKPERPRVAPILTPAIRIVTARTTRHMLKPSDDPPPQVDNPAEPS